MKTNICRKNKFKYEDKQGAVKEKTGWKNPPLDKLFCLFVDNIKDIINAFDHAGCGNFEEIFSRV